MSIKQRITIGFGLLVAASLLLFSFFIYQTYESSRRSLMRSRLQRRALSAHTYFNHRNEFLRAIYLALPDQRLRLYDPTNKLIYSSRGPDDYEPAPLLLTRARRREVYFTYDAPDWDDPKEGVALSFVNQGQRYVALITAYDLDGRQTSRNLLFILVTGNVLSLLVIALAGFIFARRAMRPFDRLVGQMNPASAKDFSFRLKHEPRRKESDYLASSFNELLSRLQTLALSQEQFVAYASYELRTPLTVVKGMLEASLANDQNLPDMRQSMTHALYRLEGALDLANALLRVAEVEGMSPAALLNSNINIVDTVLETVAYFGEKYPQQVLDVQLTDEFTRYNPTTQVLGDATLLRTALINVIDNACKYSNHQPVALRVDYRAEWVVVEVQDWGIGIPNEQLRDVFQPMMRAGNVGRVPGFGLGLTLAKKIVEMHRGQLQVMSWRDKGTTVWLDLPALPA